MTFRSKKRRRVRRVEWKREGQHDDEYEEILKKDFWLEYNEADRRNWRFVAPVVVMLIVAVAVAVIVWW